MRAGIGKVINTETAFAAGLGALIWGYRFAGANDQNARTTLFLIFVQGLIAICGGFWWKRFKQQVIGGNGSSLTSTLTAEGKVDPLMEGK